MIVRTKMMEEVVSGKFFDDLDDCGGFGVGAVDGNAFPPVWLGDGPACNGAADIPTERFVRYEDIVQLELLSPFVQDSFSKVKRLPISHVKRPRSKRPRPATFIPRATMQLPPPTYFVEARRLKKRLERQKKKRQQKMVPMSGGLDRMIRNQNEDPNATTARKCLHCGITKTPQWRIGPNGAKTLCNACGVRYKKSGQLFPEYRPAASPSFIPSLHSNSIRKVLEMRKGRTAEESFEEATAAPTIRNRQPELLLKSNFSPTTKVNSAVRCIDQITEMSKHRATEENCVETVAAVDTRINCQPELLPKSELPSVNVNRVVGCKDQVTELKQCWITEENYVEAASATKIRNYNPELFPRRECSPSTNVNSNVGCEDHVTTMRKRCTTKENYVDTAAAIRNCQTQVLPESELSPSMNVNCDVGWKDQITAMRKCCTIEKNYVDTAAAAATISNYQPELLPKSEISPSFNVNDSCRT